MPRGFCNGLKGARRPVLLPGVNGRTGPSRANPQDRCGSSQVEAGAGLLSVLVSDLVSDLDSDLVSDLFAAGAGVDESVDFPGTLDAGDLPLPL